MNIHVQAPRPTAKPRSAFEIALYRQCRAWHGYLSAFAFIALMFFSATGILLNHPDWIARDAGEPLEQSVQLAAADVAASLKLANPGQALAEIVQQGSSPLRGAFTSADIDASQALLRFEGIKGHSDVTIDLKSGGAQISVTPSDAATMLDDLHRGKNGGAVWKTLIDITGGVLLVLSVLGYILFFSLRFRLRTSLVLTTMSLMLFVGVFVLFVP
jgi:hypothetical protein